MYALDSVVGFGGAAGWPLVGSVMDNGSYGTSPDP